MPNIKKEIKFKKEQEEIYQKVLDIINKDDEDNFYLYDIEKDDAKKKELIDLIPDIKKYYKKEIYRKLRWFGFINKQRSEDCMVNNFRKAFGNPKDIIVCFGDYEQKKSLKFTPPTKGKSMRQLFRKVGYQVFLVDEYKTSKINHFTLQENEKFRKRLNPRPWKTNIVLRHGLLRSKNVTNNKSKKKTF